MNWTAEQVETLRAGIFAGDTARQIATAIGGVSAGAVRAKRANMSLPKLEFPPEPPKPSPNAGRVLELTGAPLEGSAPRLWSERGPTECAWPVAGLGADLSSCCLPIVAERGAHYCAGHMAMLRGDPWPPGEPLRATFAVLWRLVDSSSRSTTRGYGPLVDGNLRARSSTTA